MTASSNLKQTITKENETWKTITVSEKEERSLFPPELRTMAFVPRWPIMMTSIPDNLATHSYYVTVYSYAIAETIGWKGPRDYLMLEALLHDNDETITGDITGPVKQAIMDVEKAGDILYDMTNYRMGKLIDTFYDFQERLLPETVNEAERIRHVADKLDAILFLIVNKRMGNTTVNIALDVGIKSIEAAWRSLPAPKEVLDRTWQTIMIPSIEAHYVKGGRGAHPSIAI